MSCSFCVSVPPSATLISWKPRQMPRIGRPASTAPVIIGSVVASRSGSCQVPGADFGAEVAVRLDVRGAAREQDAVERREPFAQVALAERGHQHRHGVGRLDDGVDVLLADAVEPVRVQKAAIGRDSDDRLSHVHLLIILNGPRYGGLFDGVHCRTKPG